MSKDLHSPAARLKAATAARHLATEKLMGITRAGQGEFTHPAFQRLVGTNFFTWSSFLLELQGRRAGWWSEYLPLVKVITEAATADFNRHLAEERNFTVLPYPSIADQYALAGSLYVHLGSLLGGRFIHGVLLDDESLQDCRPFQFYAANLDFSGGAWRQFTEQLNAALREEDNLQAAIWQASRVFAYYQDVYSALDILLEGDK